jgi:putative NIF3 family GTP cyclohydrolase 1 type 2
MYGRLLDVHPLTHGHSYPEELADRSWDNVGLLLGNSEIDASKGQPRVLVTNDLTFQVAVDAIGQGASVIVSYRSSSPPFIPTCILF